MSTANRIKKTKKQEHHLSIDEAAHILEVSQATVRNWVKSEYLKPKSIRPIYFLQEDVYCLKDNIESGRVNRLRVRANKIKSTKNNVASEYIGVLAAKTIEPSIAKLISKSKEVDTESLMFLVCLRVLNLRKEFDILQGNVIKTLEDKSAWRRYSVQREMQNWLLEIKNQEISHLYEDISKIISAVPNGDVLGGIYQSVSNAGEKSTTGAFYTPEHICESMINSYSGVYRTFLDPCCGTGQFLLKAGELGGLNLDSLYGYDIDRIAVRICRINLLMAFKDTDLKPNIYLVDTLRDVSEENSIASLGEVLQRPDFIATNPPWGAFKNSYAIKQPAYGLQSKEYFSQFIVKSMALLEDGGKLSFILPESFFKVKAHRNVRELIVKNFQILHVRSLGRVFRDVFTPIIRLDLKKAKPSCSDRFTMDISGSKSIIRQANILSDNDYCFGIEFKIEDLEIIKKIYSEGTLSLKGNSQWALGVVTGNNEKFLSVECEDGMEPIFKGSDVKKYSLGMPKNYIKFTPSEFQQVARTHIYRASEKLVYKFISNKLVFAYDNKQRLTLNSANIVIPNIPGISIKVMCAFLNSSVLQFYFQKKFSSLKVLKGHLESLPIPVLTEESHSNIESLVDKVLHGIPVDVDLNKAIAKAYNMTPAEMHYINNNLLK